MSNRVKTSDLQRLVDEISRKQGRPLKPWTPRADGKGSVANVGALYLDCNGIYGGWDLCEILNPGGGTHSLIGNTFAGRGRLPGHEMESFLMGMLAGLETPAAQEQTRKAA